jgi:hypothetical protein
MIQEFNEKIPHKVDKEYKHNTEVLSKVIENNKNSYISLSIKRWRNMWL